MFLGGGQRSRRRPGTLFHSLFTLVLLLSVLEFVLVPGEIFLAGETTAWLRTSPLLFPAAPHHQIRACSSTANRSVPATVRRNFTLPSIPSYMMTHVAAASRAHFFTLTKPPRVAFALQSFQLFNLDSMACTMDRSEGKDRSIVPLISRSGLVKMKWYLLRSDRTQDSKIQDRQMLASMKFTSCALFKNSPSRTSKCSMFSSPDWLYLHFLHQACSGVSSGPSCFSRGRDRYNSVLSIPWNIMFLSVFRMDCLTILGSDGGVPASAVYYAPFPGIQTRRYFPNVFRHVYRFIAALLTGYLVEGVTGTVGASYSVFASSDLLFWRPTVLHCYILRLAALGGREETLIDHLGFRPIPSLLQKSISSVIGLCIGFKLFDLFSYIKCKVSFHVTIIIIVGSDIVRLLVLVWVSSLPLKIGQSENPIFVLV